MAKEHSDMGHKTLHKIYGEDLNEGDCFDFEGSARWRTSQQTVTPAESFDVVYVPGRLQHRQVLMDNTWCALGHAT